MSRIHVVPFLFLAMFCLVNTLPVDAAEPPDDPQAQQALRKLGGTLHWDADGNVWKAIFERNRKFNDAALDHVKRLPQIEILDISSTHVTDAGIAKLRGLKHVRNLNLSETKVTDAGLKHLKDLPSLQHLSLGGASISDRGLLELKEITTLKSLDLSETRITDAGLQHLTGLKNLYSLKVVSARVKSEPSAKDSPPQRVKAITDAGLVHIGKLESLETLTLSGSTVTGAGLARLKMLPKLNNLNLARTRIGDAGLAGLTEIKTLSWIWLDETNVTDAGLPQLMKLPKLQVLSLTKTKVTDAGLKSLAKFKRRVSLSLFETAVTPKGVDALPSTWSVEYDRPPVDHSAKRAVNMILWKVRKGDLQGFRAEVAKNPQAVRFRWTEFLRLGDGDGGMTPLHFAARKGDLPMLTFLLKHGADVNADNGSNRTALHLAANKQIAAALVAAGADVVPGGRRNGTPLHTARNAGVAEVLLANKAEVDSRQARPAFPNGFIPATDGRTPLANAVRDGRHDVAKVLIAHGADVNATSDGTPLLYWAAYYGRNEVIRLLIANKVRINGFKRSALPLLAAIEEKQTTTVKLLLAAGAKLPQPDQTGWTVLHSAALRCDGPMVSLLIKAGAPVDAKTHTWEPNGYPLSIPPEDRPRSTGNRTPLHVAARNGNLAAAKVLIVAGADVDALTSDKETPLSLTRYRDKYKFDPWVQDDEAGVKAYNEERRKEIETTNANRVKIANLIRPSLARQSGNEKKAVPQTSTNSSDGHGSAGNRFTGRRR